MSGQNFVLVHGAWHGGWCWREVAVLLEQQGHRCLAPTLRGLAHRATGMAHDIDADRHVDDVANLVEALDLHDVVLVLHSYAGLLGPALAARLASRLGFTVYVEAVVPAAGDCMFDLVMPEVAARLRASAFTDERGSWMPVPDVAQFQLPGAALAQAVRSQLTPHPFRTFSEPLRAPQRDAFSLPGTYVIACDRQPPPYGRFTAQARDAGWPVHAMPGGHLLMLTQPAALAAILLESARGARTVSG